MFTAFGKRAFQPMMERLLKQLEPYDQSNEGGNVVNAAMRLAEPDSCRELLNMAGLQQIEVFGAGLGRLHGGLGIGHGLGVDLGYGDAHRVIHARGAAGQNIDEVGGVRRGGKRERSNSYQ